MSTSAIPPLPPGYRLDRQPGNADNWTIPPVPPGYKLDHPATANHPPLPPGYTLDRPLQRAPQPVSQTAQGEANKPGFSQRWAEGMGIPVTQEEEDAMREEMKPKWYDFVAPGWGRGSKMLYGAGKNAVQQFREGFGQSLQIGKDADEELTQAKTNQERFDIVKNSLFADAASAVETGTKMVPGCEQLWNFGQDVREGNWRGAAGGATAAFLQALLMDAMGGERPNAPKTPSSAPLLEPPTIPTEEMVPAPRPAADASRQPSANYQGEGRAPASKPTTAAASGQRPTALQAQRSASISYRETFFKAHPELRGKVWVHHAFPQYAARLYPYVKIEVHALENLRGIPNEINPELHLKQINGEWRIFYKEYPHATEGQIRAKIAEIDAKYGERFLPLRKK